MTEPVRKTRKTRLSDDEVARFHRDGLVIPDYRLPADLLATMQAEVGRLIASNPNVRPEALSGAHNPWGQAANLIGSTTFLDLCRHPEILDMVEQLIGPDIVLWGSQLFCKPAGDGLAVPWHQDGQYWPLDPLATVTVRIAFDGSTPENGCMRYIPGSHRARRLEHHEATDDAQMALKQQVPDIDESKAVDDVLQPGMLSIHDVYLLHGSAENRSTQRRSDYAIRYMPATTRYVRDPDLPANRRAPAHMNYENRPLWLVRGVDRAGNDFQRGHGPRPP